MSKTNIVVIGGGTGSFAVLNGLKNLENINITAIVPSTDSGGSTGRLRDEFGKLPIGDIRQCLVALAKDDEQNILRELFNYRFDKGEDGLKGHNFGNLFLTALSEILGDNLLAIKKVEKILNIKGKVLPISLNQTTLCAEYENGKILKGEHHIDEPEYPHDGNLRIKRLFTEPKVSIHTEIKTAIMDADFIIIGPGDLYTSLFANLVIDGMNDVIKNSKAKLIFIINLVTKFGQTSNYKTSDFLDEFQKYTQKNPDYIFINNSPLPSNILKKYELESSYPVINNLKKSENIIEIDLLANEEIKTKNGDVLKRSLIRHDSIKVAKVIENIINKNK